MIVRYLRGKYQTQYISKQVGYYFGGSGVSWPYLLVHWDWEKIAYEGGEEGDSGKVESCTGR